MKVAGQQVSSFKYVKAKLRNKSMAITNRESIQLWGAELTPHFLDVEALDSKKRSAGCLRRGKG